MNEERLARRYRDLLDFYPRRYRDERGDELVGTLLECSRPGQTRPTWREARALAVEGLRLRAGRTPTDGVRLVTLLALATWVFTGAAERYGHHWVGVVAMAFAAVAFGLVAWGRPGWAVPLVVAGAVAAVASSRFLSPGFTNPRVDAMAAVASVCAVLLWRQRPSGRAGGGAVAYTVGLPLLLVLPTWLVDAGLNNPGDIFWLYQSLLYVVLYLAALAWAPIDPRPALGMAAFIALYVVQIAVTLAGVGFLPDIMFLAIAGLLLVAGAVAAVAARVGVRRRVAVASARAEG